MIQTKCRLFVFNFLSIACQPNDAKYILHMKNGVSTDTLNLTIRLSKMIVDIFNCNWVRNSLRLYIDHINQGRTLLLLHHKIYCNSMLVVYSRRDCTTHYLNKKIQMHSNNILQCVQIKLTFYDVKFSFLIEIFLSIKIVNNNTNLSLFFECPSKVKSHLE